MIIRPETPADYEAIRRVVINAFGRSDEARLVHRIRVSGAYVPSLALVAEDEGEITGHVMFSYATLRARDERRVLNLAPVSVRFDRQNQGIGSALVEEGLRLADGMGEPLVMVLGHPGYYPRFGFERARACGIEPASPNIPDAAFMVRKLAAYDSSYRGTIIYPPAFDGV